jgi:hypothetical protein
MQQTLKHISRGLKQIIFSILALLLAFFLSLLLLPFVLVLLLSLMIFTWILIARQRRPAKGEVEILPAEKSSVKSTSDTELEITIESLQRKHGKQIEPKNPSDNP